MLVSFMLEILRTKIAVGTVTNFIRFIIFLHSVVKLKILEKKGSISKLIDFLEENRRKLMR